MGDWFSKEVSLGNVITICSLLIVFYRYHMQNTKKLNVLMFRVKLMWGAFKKEYNLRDEDDETND